MNVVFYVSAAVAIVATLMAVTRLNAVHALLYLIVSLLAVAMVFFVLGAPFVAALEAIVYAGAIMVLFLFVVMMLNVSPESMEQERSWWSPWVWAGAAALAVVLLMELIWAVVAGKAQALATAVVGPKQVGILLFGPYLLGVELASVLLLVGLVGAYHLGHRSGES